MKGRRKGHTSGGFEKGGVVAQIVGTVSCGMKARVDVGNCGFV